MAFTSYFNTNQSVLEYGKFIRLDQNTSFPPVSVTNYNYPDIGTPPTSSVQVFPKYAVLTYDVSTGSANGNPFGDNSSVDSFGRLRVTQPSTLLDSKNLYSKNTFVFDEVINGAATSTFSAFDSCVDMRTNADGDYVIRQTRVRYNYQPGKGMQFMFTGLFKPEANIIKRVGCFQSLTAAPYEPSDGIFLEVTGNGPAFRIVKTQGTPHTNYAPQSAWNIDRLDGTGPSGITIDFTKAVLFTVDFEWLSVGRVRFGFFYNGRCYYAHADSHDGELTAPYMTYSNQPVRYEIRQTGLGSGLLRQICSTALVEGGTENVGKPYAIEDGGVSVQSGVYTPVLALQINPSQSNIVSIIRQVDVLNTGGSPGAPAKYALFLNPNLIGGSLTFSPVSRTSMLSAAGNASISVTEGVSGFKLLTGFAALGQGGQSSIGAAAEIASNLSRFGVGVRGDPDTMVLAAKGLGNTTGIYGSINLIEKA